MLDRFNLKRFAFESDLEVLYLIVYVLYGRYKEHNFAL